MQFEDFGDAGNHFMKQMLHKNTELYVVLIRKVRFCLVRRHDQDQTVWEMIQS